VRAKDDRAGVFHDKRERKKALPDGLYHSGIIRFDTKGIDLAQHSARLGANVH
jgi:hypothetical protein